MFVTYLPSIAFFPPSLYWMTQQAVDEISSLEVMCEKLSESIKNIQSERLNLEKTYRRMTEELKHLIAQWVLHF